MDPAIRCKLLHPKEKIELTANPVLLDGRRVHVESFIVKHSDALGPAKGGIRMSPTVTMDDITGLAMEMTWKTALIGVPFGGGKSGIQFDPASVSPMDKEVIIRAFARAARLHIGPEIYVPAPDMGTNEADMGHIRDCIAYSSGTAITQGCFVTGKPVILGGIEGRREATGRGVVFSILAAGEKLGLDIRSARVAVQGFGNVGSVAATEIARLGAKVVAVSDVSGGVINEAGLDVEALLRHVGQSGAVRGFAWGRGTDNAAVLEADCDILIPAAKESQITVDNAERIKARLIAEGANAPTTPDADEILNRHKVFIIPDILCNAGGVFVSYLEYTQETQREQTVAGEVNRRLSDRMRAKFEEVHNYASGRGVSMRHAAMDVAVGRVVAAIEALGALP
jgi:glutamate dehydrogenase (NAD(P)+)